VDLTTEEGRAFLQERLAFFVGSHFAALLILTNLLPGRAIIAPSEPRRTLRLGVAAALPALVATSGLTIVAPLTEEALLGCAGAGDWGEREARRWWRENGARVRELRARLPRERGSTMPTVAVRLEERLRAGVGP
jgi:hypothetical protein